MKKLATLLTIFVIQFTVSAQVNNLNVKGVDVGTYYSTAIRNLGKPSSVKRSGQFPCDDGKMITANYPGLVVKFVESFPGKKFFVGSMEVTSAKYAVSGVRIGDRLSRVKSLFSGSLRKEEGFDVYGGYINDGFSRFYFKNDRLRKIVWEINLC